MALEPDYVVFAGWPENTLWPGSSPSLSTVSTAWGRFLARMEQVRLAGKQLILLTPFCNGNLDAASAFTSYSAGNGTKAHYWWCAKVREYASRYRDSVIFLDAAAIYVDPNVANPVWAENAATYLSAAGSGQQLKKTDGIHPNHAANWLIGQAMATLLQQSVPAVDHFATGSGDAYNMAPNPLNYGTAGTLGTGASGSVANNQTLTAYGTGGAVTGSKVARTDAPGSWQRAAYSASTGDNVDLVNSAELLLAGKGISAGDVVQLFAEIRIAANPVLLTHPRAQMRFRTDSSDCTAPTWSYAGNHGSSDQDLGQFITSDTTFILKTHPTKVPADCTRMNIHRKVFGRGACNFTADFGRATVRPVTVPTLS